MLYYKAYGPLTNFTLPPLILMHGGPGLTHDYLLPLADIAHQNEGQVMIFYDETWKRAFLAPRWEAK